MKQLLLAMLFVFSALSLMAQKTVTGTITDSETGEPVVGVTVVVKGTTKGAITDFNGEFSISVSEDQTLVISYVGYRTQEIPVGARSTIDVELSPDVTELGEVVVIGYGQTTVKDATGAVTSVQAKDFNQGVISSPEQLIQGKSAGVQMTQVSGAPGAGVQLRIRGTNSVRSNNNPLFVVDGVPLSGGTTSSPADVGAGTIQDTNPLNFINPSDIASISILKDASATAIYGSRGANGVVIITTKKGRGLEDQFEFASSVSVASAAKRFDLLKATDEPYFLQGIGQFGGDASAQNFGGSTDWQDVILRTAVSHKQNLAYNTLIGDNTRVRASLGYEDQQGILENSRMERFTGRINASRSFLDDKLNLSLNSTYSNVDREDPPVSASAGFDGDLLGAAYSANPTWPNDPNFDAGAQRNPANMLENIRSVAVTERVLNNLSAEYAVSDQLTAKVTYGIDYSLADRVTLNSPSSLSVGDNVNGVGLGQINENMTLSHLVEVTTKYKNSFGIVDVDLLGGYSFQSFRNRYHWAVARGFTDQTAPHFSSMESELREAFDAMDAQAQSIYGEGEYNNWGASGQLNGFDGFSEGGFVTTIFPEADISNFERPQGVTVDAIGANFYDRTDYLQSFFARGNFTIAEKFLITATVRVDGSSTFGDDNKYGVFPSGAVAWQLHQENFIPDVFNTLKLRAGYGITGNQDGLGYANFVRRERWFDVGLGNNGEINNPGSGAQGELNPGLKWEETKQQMIGMDFGLFESRLYGSLDFYLKETQDLLLNINVAQPALSNTRFDNFPALVENKGWELALGYVAVEQNDVSLTIDGNVSQNKNEVKNFEGRIDAGTIRGQGLTGAFAQQFAGGRPLFSYYLREFRGFDGDGQPIGDNQKFVGKSALPEWNAGLSIDLRIGNFDFSAYAAGQFGFWVYNNTKNAFFTAGSIGNGRNVTADVLNSTESPQAAADVSTRFLEKGDFVRMQSMSLGYTFPGDRLGSTFKALRVYVNAQNLFLITGYSGLDPEVSTNPADFDLLNGLPTAGIDYTAYPRPRVFTLGLNATF